MTNFAVIGDPIKHTLSPNIHNHNFELNGDENTYVALHITPEQLPNIRQTIEDKHLLGLNVTIPHKQTIMTYLDEISPEATSIGAVNTVHVNDGRLIGYNTDVSGYKKMLLEHFDIAKDMKVLILGGGGAAKAVHYVHHQLGGTVTVAVRNVEKMKKFSELPYEVLHFGNVDLSQYDCIINATPIGLNGEDVIETLGIEPNFKNDAIGIDLIYHTKTPFLSYFNGNSIGGLNMLVHQAMDAYAIWTGKVGQTNAVKEMLKTII